MKSEELLTVKEFSDRFGLSRNWVYELIRDDKIPHYRIYGSIRLDVNDFKVTCYEQSASEWSDNKGHTITVRAKEG